MRKPVFCVRLRLACAAIVGIYIIAKIRYIAISKSGKMIFLDEKIRHFFTIFAQNIDCGYKLEPRF